MHELFSSELYILGYVMSVKSRGSLQIKLHFHIEIIYIYKKIIYKSVLGEFRLQDDSM